MIASVRSACGCGAVLAALALSGSSAACLRAPGLEGQDAAEAKPDGEAPRQEDHSAERKPNRLVREKSPYLRQHAYNPVDWHPWGGEAFERARAEGKPIFLSIGYSTCHWCHVMERESFENEEIAAYLNEHFISVKVDREERPDVDGVYMEAVQAFTGGRGGWPLTAFLTADKKPFFGGTYFPPDYFLSLLKRVVEVWGTEREVISRQADRIAEHLREESVPSATRADGGALRADATAGLFTYLESAHDPVHGGFGGPPRYAPKFPRTSNLDFLLRYARRTGTSRAEEIAYHTLDRLVAGGIRDHLGGGFHRYSTDREWVLPHFEKMLYDNALIARTLIDAYRASGKDHYIEVARETLDYVLRRLRDPRGGFYSAEDADTEGVEGLTYVWTRREVVEVLGEGDGALFSDRYAIEEKGNFEPERPEPKLPAHQNVLYIPRGSDLSALGKRHGLSRDEVETSLAASRARLLAVRDKRPQPFLDTKVLTEWNGFMISALAHGYQATGESRYLEAAREAAAFLAEEMVREDGLYRRYREGEVMVRAFLEDHAAFVEGLLDLFESDFDRRWLELAARLGKEMVRHFWDPEDGGFFSSAPHHESLLVRRKEFYDGAVPSGNSVAFLDLLRLEELTQDEAFRRPADRMRGIGAGLLASAPHAHPQLACTVEFLLAGPLEIVIVGSPDDAVTRAMLSEVRTRFRPAKVVIHAPSDEAAKGMSALVPLLEGKTAISGKPAAFVCRERVCRLPSRDVESLRKELESATAAPGEVRTP